LFPFPYVHVIRINESTKARIDEPIIYSTAFAAQYSSIAPNASGDLGGGLEWGGGNDHENCGAVIHDSAVAPPSFWEFQPLVTSDSDTAEAKSGDYTTTRGLGSGWVSACYALQGGGGGNGYVHAHYVTYHRSGAPPPPPPPPPPPFTPPKCVVPRVVGKLLPTAKTRIRRAHCRVGKVSFKASANRKRNRVLFERPRPGTRLRNGARVSLVVGRGRRR
jgi:hypothetical protein